MTPSPEHLTAARAEVQRAMRELDQRARQPLPHGMLPLTDHEVTALTACPDPPAVRTPMASCGAPAGTPCTPRDSSSRPHLGRRIAANAQRAHLTTLAGGTYATVTTREPVRAGA